MSRKLYRLLVGLVFIFVAFLNSLHSHAVLGEPLEPIKTNNKNLSEARNSSIYQPYQVRETTQDSTSTVVREYALPGAGGKVFGIFWIGKPDLHTLLGNYFDDYQNALNNNPRQRGKRFRKVMSRVVVEQWGTLRKLQGRAYDPSLIPAGIRLEEIK